MDATPSDGHETTIHTTTRTTSASLSRRSFLARSGHVGVAGVTARLTLAGLAGAASFTPTPAFAASSKPDKGPDGHGAGVLDDWYRTLYSGLMDDPSVTPGRAARIYATCAIAGYEALVPGSSDRRSLAGQLNGLTKVPVTTPSQSVDWPTAASAAIAAAAADLLRNAPAALRNAVSTQRAVHVDQRLSAGVSSKVLTRSAELGRTVGEHIGAWARGDGAEATFTRPYTPPVGDALWRSTAPNFGPAIDPYWGSVRPMALPSADVCKPVPPIAFSTEVGSEFYDQALAVMAATASIDEAGRQTSLFWRDNPTTSGLPSGHWMRIVAELSVTRGLSLAASAEALTIAGITLNDAFISCWHEKYTTNLLRPISYIRAHVVAEPGQPDPKTWSSFVNTPQFPEYTSGHSVASQAVATVLTSVLGNIGFEDRTHMLRNPQLGVRSFASFQDAATQAAGSRLLGGIHYPMGIDVGLEQGYQVGQRVLTRVKTRTARR